MSSLKLNTNLIPVELTTTEGYNEFVKSPLCNDYSTVFPDNDLSHAYVFVNDEIVATVSGEAMSDLLNYSKSGYLANTTSDSSK
ncbi:hypothetical protein WICMUC_003784 [Wickerhamomyces mucosus]|uniref:Uncharacterized protein n=1 Tax=Wickerhamomyces mucosus TaxID=1378264 RepID=A0A9P8TC57_9ASCO|nr:hypothetical protein WICMUC_003784 [Wickerhamomyces mucosus]